jgi:hypothetical protein
LDPHHCGKKEKEKDLKAGNQTDVYVCIPMLLAALFL